MKKQKNKLLIIEGADGSGKGTQVELLLQTLKKHKCPTTVFDFPRYEGSLFGALAGRALQGEFGDFRAMSPYIASLPYALDRSTAGPHIKQALKKGLVICNRYTPSNIAFQSTKLAGKAKQRFIQFMEDAEYGELELPRPTLVIYLYVPPAISYKLIVDKAARSYLGKKKGMRDQHESQRSFQNAVVKTYRELAHSRPDWRLINCTEKGKLLSREAIHAKIMAVLEKDFF